MISTSSHQRRPISRVLHGVLLMHSPNALTTSGQRVPESLSQFWRQRQDSIQQSTQKRVKSLRQSKLLWLFSHRKQAGTGAIPRSLSFCSKTLTKIYLRVRSCPQYLECQVFTMALRCALRHTFFFIKPLTLPCGCCIVLPVGKRN